MCHLKETQVKPKPTIQTVVEVHPEPKLSKNQFSETSNLRGLRADKENRLEVKDTCIQTEPYSSSPSRSISPAQQKGSSCCKKVHCKETVQINEQQQHHEQGQNNKRQCSKSERKGPMQTGKESAGKQRGNFASSSGKSFGLSEVGITTVIYYLPKLCVYLFAHI